jgi:VanZ family protein
MKNFFKYHFPAILFGILILGVSSISHLNLPRVRSIQLDKILHFLEYAVFSALVFRSFSHFPRHHSVNRAAVLAFSVMVIFAFGDEFYQGFVPGRHRDWADWAADLAGSVFMLIWLWWRRRHHRSNAP